MMQLFSQFSTAKTFARLLPPARPLVSRVWIHINNGATALPLAPSLTSSGRRFSAMHGLSTLTSWRLREQRLMSTNSPPSSSSSGDPSPKTANSTPQQLKPGYSQIFKNNRAWRDAMLAQDPNYFKNLAKGQSPRFVVIGCSDSRVPFETISGLDPGDVFVHRNIANVVPNTDLNSVSVLQLGIEVLKVDHILVCGHYGCSGVKMAMQNKDPGGPMSLWFTNIRDVIRIHRAELESIKDEEQRYRRLIELNVTEQCRNILKMPFVQKAKVERRTGSPRIHAVVYDIEEGLLKELNYSSKEDLVEHGRVYRVYDEKDFDYFYLLND